MHLADGVGVEGVTRTMNVAGTVSNLRFSRALPTGASGHVRPDDLEAFPSDERWPGHPHAAGHYLGHENIQHTVIYTEMAPDRFKHFWRGY
jgi:hypothetical protein